MAESEGVKNSSEQAEERSDPTLNVAKSTTTIITPTVTTRENPDQEEPQTQLDESSDIGETTTDKTEINR